MNNNNIEFHQNLISENKNFHLVQHQLEYITKLNSIIFDEDVVSETSIQKNWWNFTSSIFNKEYINNIQQLKNQNINSKNLLRETLSVFYNEKYICH